MSGFAVSSIINSCQIHFPDLPPSVALGLINDVNSNIAQYVRLYPETVIQVGLTSNVGAYNFPLNTYLVKEVNYAYNSNPQSPIKLWPTNTDFLDQNFPSWRWTANPSQPTYYYLDSNTIGFWPIPNQSTVGVGSTALPIINVYCMQINATPLGINDFISPIVPSSQLYVYGICKLWSVMYHPEKLEIFNSLYTTEYTRFYDFVNNIEERDPQTIIMRMPRITRR